MEQQINSGAAISDADQVRKILNRVEKRLLLLHPLQWELIDFHIRKRFLIGPDFITRHNPDKETRSEYMARYCAQLADHISKKKINNLDIQIEWLINTLQ